MPSGQLNSRAPGQKEVGLVPSFHEPDMRECARSREASATFHCRDVEQPRAHRRRARVTGTTMASRSSASRRSRCRKPTSSLARPGKAWAISSSSRTTSSAAVRRSASTAASARSCAWCRWFPPHCSASPRRSYRRDRSRPRPLHLPRRGGGRTRGEHLRHHGWHREVLGGWRRVEGDRCKRD